MLTVRVSLVAVRAAPADLVGILQFFDPSLRLEVGEILIAVTLLLLVS